jgi:hypothetical protein
MNPMTMTCSTSAQQGDCADELAACMASPECVALNMCFQACMAGDQMCLNTCVMMNMAGYQVYNAINLCVVCDNCPTSCAALAMQLMCP